MPELPEVETVVREIRPALVGRTILSVRAGRKQLRRRWSSSWTRELAGQRVEEVGRRGKWIIIRLASGAHLIVHLGMTGQLTVVPAEQPARSHTHLVFTLADEPNELRFRDVRRFGSATLFTDAEKVTAFFAAAKLGPEPFDIDPDFWRSRLAATSRCLKAALLDQGLVAGVGNIYADESLYEARLPPTQLGRATTPAEADRLRRAIGKVLTRAIEQRGSSIRDYVGGFGEKGSYQNEFRVYGRTGEPCRRCGTPIERIRLAGRSTHFCPRCRSSPEAHGRRPVGTARNPRAAARGLES